MKSNSPFKENVFNMGDQKSWQENYKKAYKMFAIFREIVDSEQEKRV